MATAACIENATIQEKFVEPVLHEVNAISKHRYAVGQALLQRINSIDVENCSPGDEDSFFVADLGVVYRQFLRFRDNLPRVTPFYAVKCNGDLEVLKLLAKLGTSFDCASKTEIEAVLGLGVDSSRIIYANPCKAMSHLRYAKQHGVDMMTFDNSDELLKIKKINPGAQLLLRLVTDDSGAICQLSTKFGCQMADVSELLGLAKDLELDVVGVAFHVGSGSSDPSAFSSAVDNARQVFDQARRLGFDMKVLDVGGGFSSETFESTSQVLNYALEEYFPEEEEPNLRIIAEPGRYFVASAFVLASSVIGRRWLDSSRARIYVNDGVYGNLNSIIFDHQEPVAKMLKSQSLQKFYYYSDDSQEEGTSIELSIWGPTCDGLDCLTKSCKLPAAPEIGDWIYFENTGAYTLAASTQFNGFNTQCEVIYVFSGDLQG